MKNNYGLQMYSLRDITDKDLKGALKAVAEMGYKNIEFAGFFGHPAEDVKVWLEEYGLNPIGTHTAFELLEEKFEETVEYHKALGCKNIIIPIMSGIETKEKMKQKVEKINKWVSSLKKEGIELHFHNHSDEFRELEPGYVPMDYLAENTDILFEIDTFWAYFATGDPIGILKKYKDRIKFIHSKDGLADGKECSLGLGVAPTNEVVTYAIENGLEIIVESEGCDPTGIEEVKRCIDFLANIEK